MTNHRHPSEAPHDPPAYTVETFCEAHHIARSYFYTLLREGDGPEIYKLGRRTYVSGAAAAEWRRKLEARTSGERRSLESA